MEIGRSKPPMRKSVRNEDALCIQLAGPSRSGEEPLEAREGTREDAAGRALDDVDLDETRARAALFFEHVPHAGGKALRRGLSAATDRHRRRGERNDNLVLALEVDAEALHLTAADDARERAREADPREIA